MGYTGEGGRLTSFCGTERLILLVAICLRLYPDWIREGLFYWLYWEKLVTVNMDSYNLVRKLVKHAVVTNVVNVFSLN